MHGGRVEVYSVLGQGSEFVVHLLPVATTSLAFATAVDGQRNPSLQQGPSLASAGGG